MDPSLTVLPPNANTPGAPSGSDAPAGIHCANPDCRTRAGERSRGHQSCRALLCGHCCQSAAKAAAEAGEQRPVCKVHSRRVHTGHRPLPKDSQPQQHQHHSVDAPNGIIRQEPIGWPPATEPPPQELQELFEKRAHLERSLKRSLTVVVWYRNGAEPLRIPHEVTTFPLFRLQDFPELIQDLQLQPTAYIDAYNPETGQWEQHKLSTVRSVEHDHRLLYRVRLSLIEGLSDCPALDQEIALQRQPSPLKRQADSFSTPLPAGKQGRFIANASPVRPSQAVAGAIITNPGTLVVSPSGSRTEQTWTPATEGSVSAPPGGGSSWGFVPSGAVNRSSHILAPSPPPTPAQGGPVAKKWPTDFSVHDITQGFRVMEQIMTSDPRERQRTAFERVFGCRYVKSTVGRAKLYWKRASREIKDHFLALPKDDPRGRWQNFVHLMDGRLVIEVGKEGEAAGEEGGKESGDEDRADEEEVVNGALGFGGSQQTQMHQAHVGVHSPEDIQHPSMTMSRQPGQNEMLRQSAPGPMVAPERPMNPNHQLNPVMPIPQTYAADRNINMNRSSSSLSGAITIPSS